MQRCNGECKLWFSDHELENGQCIFCAEPWAEHPDDHPGLDLPNGPPGYLDLLEKMEIQHTRHEILLPYAHDPKNYYVEAVVFQDRSRYWYIEGRPEKYKKASEAILEVVQLADIKRTKMLNEEFEREFGSGQD